MTQTIYILKPGPRALSQLSVDALDLLQHESAIFYDPSIANPSLLQLAQAEAQLQPIDLTSVAEESEGESDLIANIEAQSVLLMTGLDGVDPKLLQVWYDQGIHIHYLTTPNELEQTLSRAGIHFIGASNLSWAVLHDLPTNKITHAHQIYVLDATQYSSYVERLESIGYPASTRVHLIEYPGQAEQAVYRGDLESILADLKQAKQEANPLYFFKSVEEDAIPAYLVVEAEALPPIPVTAVENLQSAYHFIALPADAPMNLILEVERHGYVAVLYSPGQDQEERDQLVKDLIQKAVYFWGPSSDYNYWQDDLAEDCNYINDMIPLAQVIKQI